MEILRGFRKLACVRVILLEDEAKVRGYLLESFEREGFTTLSFANVPDLKDYLETEESGADLAVLDRMVGPVDGCSLLPLFQAKFPRTKILVLSALNDAEERAKILDRGADDYMGKPYSLAELLSRMRALYRREHGGGARERTVLSLGNLEIHLLDQKVKVAGKPLELTPKEFRLLSLLARDPGKVWSKYRLLDQVWQINLELESNVVETMIRNLRRKLEGAASSARIESKRGTGYWIEA